MDTQETPGAGSDEPAGDAAPSTPTTQGAGSDEPANPSKRELAQLQRQFRQQGETIAATNAALAKIAAALEPRTRTAQAKEEPAKPLRERVEESSSAVSELRAEIRFMAAVADLGVPVTREQRSRLEKLYRADKMPENVEEWLAAEVAALGIKKPTSNPVAVAAPADAAKPPAKSDRGPAGGAPALSLGDDVLNADPSVLRAMDADERKKWLERSIGVGLGSHPAHRSKRRT